MSLSSRNNLHNDPSPNDQYLFALNQLFAYTNPYYTFSGTNTVEALNRGNYWGHYVGHLPKSNPTMNVCNTNYYSSCIDTGIHQSITSVTDVLAPSDVGNIIFVACKCQLPSRNCNVDISLTVGTPVSCSLDFRFI